MIQQRTADVDGTPVRWLEQGSGVAVVLVHGIPASPALWRHVVTMDATGRPTADTDATGRTVRAWWSSFEQHQLGVVVRLGCEELLILVLRIGHRREVYASG